MPGLARFGLMLLLAVLALSHTVAHAQAYRIVVSYAAGGYSDIAARVVASALTRELNAPVVVENRPGAGGMIGLQFLAGSPPENTIGILAPGMVVAAAADRGNPLDRIQGLSIIGISGMVVAARAGDAPSDFAALMQRGRSKSITFGTPGEGSMPDRCARQIAKVANLTGAVIVPYKGSGPMLSDLVAGQLDASCVDIASALSFFASGKLKALALTLPYPHEKLPGVPTLESLGVHGVPSGNWQMFVAPKSMDRARVVTLAAAVSRALMNSDVRQKFRDMSVDLIPAEDATPEIAEQFLRRQISVLAP